MSEDGTSGGSAARELFRAVNEQVQALAATAGAVDLDYVCECANLECYRTLRMTPEVFDGATSDGWFVVIDGHQDDRDEVLSGGNGYVLVRRAPTAA